MFGLNTFRSRVVCASLLGVLFSIVAALTVFDISTGQSACRRDYGSGVFYQPGRVGACVRVPGRALLAFRRW